MLRTHLLLALGLAAASCSGRSGSTGSGGNSSTGGGSAMSQQPFLGPQALPTSVTLGDGTALLGDPIRMDITGGDTPIVDINVVGRAGATTWTLIAEFDIATFKTGTLMATVTQARTGPGRASLQRWTSQIPTPAPSGSFILGKSSTGIWTGTVTTDRVETSATITGPAAITCYVPVTQLGLQQNGTPGPGVGPDMAPDTTFKTPFCAQFK